jgi:predicted RNA-binding Zn ribbon-like protein
LVVSSGISKIPIEPEVDLVVEFVNTRDLETGADLIGEPQALERWIDDRLGGPGVGTVGPESRRRLLALRESLRALLRTNNGGEAGDDELLALREAVERSRFQTALHEGGRLGIQPAGGGPEAFEARLLLALERIQSLGAWPRLKACPTDDCQWAFYDTSRNRSRTWCSMDECGNREKTRRYRRRKASA